MSINSDALGQVIERIPAEWKRTQAWAEKVFTKERVRDTSLVLSTLFVWGLLFFGLNNALHDYVIVGF